jgi:hypothetical protein
MTTRMVMAYTGRSRAPIIRAVAAGSLVPAGKHGRSYSFRKCDVDAWLVGAPLVPVVGAAERRTSVASRDVSARIREIARGGR